MCRYIITCKNVNIKNICIQIFMGVRDFTERLKIECLQRAGYPKIEARHVTYR